MSKEGSVLDPDLVEEALGGVGEVYHVAGLPGMWIPDSGTEVVIAAARKRGIARFVHCSTESIQRAWFLSSERGQVGHRYILGSESIPLKSSRACGGDQRPPSSAHSGSRSGRGRPLRSWSSSAIT
jgi:hypothetical protein